MQKKPMRFVEDVLELFVQHSTAARLLDIVGSGRRGALNLVEVASYRARMFKGLCERIAEVDQACVDASVAAQGRAFASVGVPADATQRMLAQGDSLAMAGLRMRVDAVFDQSPKPGAGAPL